MATTSNSPRLIVELAPHSLQIVLVEADGRVVFHRDCALDAAAVSAALGEAGLPAPAAAAIATVAPASAFILRSGAEEAASVRTAKSLLAKAEAIAGSPAASLNVAAFDAANGQRVDTVGKAPWVMAGVSSGLLADAKEKLSSLGINAAAVRLAAPAGIGAVVAALQDMPESTRVLVWQPGSSEGLLACVSAGGCEAAGSLNAGFDQIFEAVQAGLGLKFRAAATKLFFNPGYDFSETSGAIAERLAALLRPAVAGLGCAPTVLHVVGLPAAQSWLARALAAALDIEVFAPKVAEFSAQCGLKGDLTKSGDLPASSIGVLFQSASASEEAPWRPAWLDASAPAPAAAAPAPAPAKPAPAPAPVKPAAPAPAPAVDPVPAAVAPAPAAPKPSPVAPKPLGKPAPAGPTPIKPAAAPAPAPVAAAPAPVAPAPAPVKPAPVAPAPKPAPVAKAAAPAPAPAVVPAPVVEEAPAPRSAAEELPAVEPAAPAKKKPVALIGAIAAAVVVLGGAGAFFAMRGGGGSGTQAAAAAPATLSADELRMREVEQARMLAEELKNPRSFRNDRYSFEVSDRGFLRKLVGAGTRTLIDEFGWLELQGTISGTSTPFYAGTMGDTDYQASVNKTVRDGKVVFEIRGVHPRFTIETVVTCLPDKILVDTLFKPLNMREARGLVSGTYMVKMNRQSLSLGQRAEVAPGLIKYSTQSGPVQLKFNTDVWGQTGEAGKQTFMVGSNLVFFYFAGDAAPTGTKLSAELSLP